MTTGYQHSRYARSFTDNPGVIFLENCGGWVLRRSIDDGAIEDLANPYPMFVCRDAAAIESDLEDIDTARFASLYLRTDPFDDSHIERDLRSFDVIRPFKTHYVALLDEPWRKFARRSSRKLATRAWNQFEFRSIPPSSARPQLLWDLLRSMFENRGVRKLFWTREIIAAQLQVPGMTVFEATDAGQTHAMACFLTVEERVYAHHLGVTEEGRAKNIIHGMYAFALDHFSGRARYLDFGSNTGITDNPDDGLSRFKQGWCSETRRSFVGGKILNTDLYHRLCRDRGVRQSAYFPAYRTPAAANTG